MIEFLESLLKYKLELLISILLDFNVNKITFVYFIDGKCVLVQSSELAVIYLFPIYSENLIGAKKNELCCQTPRMMTLIGGISQI